MTKTAEHIKGIKNKIAKLEKDFKRGVPKYFGFTIDISYGGNRHHDIPRVEVGSIADEEQMSQMMYNIAIGSLKNSLKFWKETAEREIKELQESIEGL